MADLESVVLDTDIDKYFNSVKEKSQAEGEVAIAALQLMRIYRAAASYRNGKFLELGTDRGQASKVILAACKENGGRLVSVDIRDCSKVVKNDFWRFVQSDSVDRDRILSAAPFLKEGINLIYVDSLHTPEHVLREIYTWFDLVVPGGVIFFDDIDSAPYMQGRRKDNPKMEISNRMIFEVVRGVFYGNLDQLQLTVDFGSTGLAILKKTSPLGSKLKEYKALPPARKNLFLAKIMSRMSRGYYYNKGDGSDFI